ncbi:hypothetical protein HGRIS_011247 [Hohenbuehelia grisea]|uniref:Protein kinase domain-containing protein n=1 Tax=Hohenbuehelia grisea TaxID=104357 RepID=A0ABR3JUJ8_9AGAR
MLGPKLDETVFKRIVIHMLRSLDFLHTKAKMVHTDIRPQNIHLTPVDDVCFELMEQVEFDHIPSNRKVDGERIIYVTCPFELPSGLENFGVPVLIDYGEARFGQDTYMDRIQPYMYQAPEVIFNVPWSYSADIWNAGVMFWDFFEGKRLLSAADDDGNESIYHLAAEMVALMGSPPQYFLDSLSPGPRNTCFGNNGNWSCPKDIQIPALSLETAETALKNAGKDSTAFLDFMRRIIVWDPRKRPSAAQLLEDPWLKDVVVPETGLFEV